MKKDDCWESEKRMEMGQSVFVTENKKEEEALLNEKR